MGGVGKLIEIVLVLERKNVRLYLIRIGYGIN